MLKWKQDSVTMRSTTTSIAWTDTWRQAENKAKRRMRYPSKAELWLSSGSEIVREREQEQMTAGATPSRMNNKHTHHFRCRLIWIVGGRVRGGISRGRGLEMVSTMAFVTVQVTPMITTSGHPSDEWTPTHHKPRLCLLALQVLSQLNCYCSSQDFSICFQCQVVRSLFGASRADTLWFCCCIVVVWCIATTVFGKDSRCVSIPHSIHCNCERTLWWLQTDTFFIRYETRCNSMVRSNVLTRNGHATPMPLGGNVTRSSMISVFQAFTSVFSDRYCDTMEMSNSQVRQVESAGKGNFAQTRCVDLENMRIFSWDWNLKS